MSLAKLMLSQANFLLLDEPTNHLDITSKEILENALNTYEGTVFYVSHDRYFINRTATRILDLTNQQIVNYIGNYDYYLAKKDELTQAMFGTESQTGTLIKGTSEHKAAVSASSNSDAQSSGSAGSAQSWAEAKAEQARIRKIQNQIKKCEEEIDKNETRSAEIDELLSQEEIATDLGRCAELAREQEELSAANEKLMEQWEALQEELGE